MGGLKKRTIMAEKEEIKKIEIKEKLKDEVEWKNISSSDKDEILFELARKSFLIPNNMVYK